jgi:hypothetical protein
MKTTTKSRVQKRGNVRDAGTKAQFIFAHRPAIAYTLGLSGLSAQEIVRGALPGCANAEDFI